MPKIPPPKNKPLSSKKTVPKKKLLPPPDPAEALAAAADREGLLARDLIRFPELLAKYRLPDISEAPHATARRADALNRELIDVILTKYNKPKKAEPSEYDAPNTFQT